MQVISDMEKILELIENEFAFNRLVKFLKVYNSLKPAVTILSFLLCIGCAEPMSRQEHPAHNKTIMFRLIVNSKFSCSNIIEVDASGAGTSVVGRANGDRIDSVWGRKNFSIHSEGDLKLLKVAIDSILVKPSVDPITMDDAYRFNIIVGDKKVLDTYHQDSYLSNILALLLPYVEIPEAGQCDFFNLYRKVYDQYIVPGKQASTNKERQIVVQEIRSDTTRGRYQINQIRQLSKHLNLEPVENGFDSLQIRVWFDHSLAYKKQLVVLELKNKEWAGKFYEIRVADNGMLNYDFIRHFSKKEVKPQSGWEKLIERLEQLKIRDLSGNNQSGADGATFSVEILTRKSYTYYDFWEPESIKKINWQAANMAGIIALLQQDFEFVYAH